MKEELTNFGILECHASLQKLNTYQINTSTKYLLHPYNISALQRFLKYAKKNKVPYFILGNGSNVILSDTEYPGVIVKLDKLSQIEYHEEEVRVGAGVMINFLAYDLISHGLKGLEWASGIPGTIGGCIFGNAEAYKVSTFEHLVSVTYLSKDGTLHTKLKEELKHGYRTSYFKTHPDYIIVDSTFHFDNGNKEESLALIKDRLNRRLASQPLEYPSAGSVFRNPSPDLPSGRLINELGLKGYQIGGSKVSEKHANFIINVDHATGKDIRNLISYIHEQVLKNKQIDLVLEQEFKNW